MNINCDINSGRRITIIVNILTAVQYRHVLGVPESMPIARVACNRKGVSGIPFLPMYFNHGASVLWRIERSFYEIWSEFQVFVDCTSNRLSEIIFENFACVCMCVSWYIRCVCVCVYVCMRVERVSVPAWLRAYSWSNEHMDDGIDRNLRRTWSWLSELKNVVHVSDLW